MPDPYRTVVAAVDRLTTQVTRVADALFPPPRPTGYRPVGDRPEPTTAPVVGPRVGHWLPTPPANAAAAEVIRRSIDAAMDGAGTRLQPAYDAVFTYIRSLPRDALPASTVERNAIIWRGVHAALGVLPVVEEATTPGDLDHLVRHLRREIEVANDVTAYAKELLVRRTETLRTRAEQAEQHRDQLAATLRDVLGHFVHKGHPGQPCLQTGWIPERTVATWRTALTAPAAEEEPAETTYDDSLTLPTLATLAAMFEGFARLITTSSRDWSAYRVDGWLYACLVGWDCEDDHEHDDDCDNGAMQEQAERWGWDEDAVAKARRYRALVRAITNDRLVAEEQPTKPDLVDTYTDPTIIGKG